MNTQEFLSQVVYPDLEGVSLSPADLRTAYHAIHSVDALAARVFWDKKNADKLGDKASKDDTEFREKLATESRDFALLRDIAKAAKHVELTRGSPKVSNAQQIGLKSLGWDEATWDETPWDCPEIVVVKSNTGEYRILEALLRNSVDFLTKQI